MLVKLMALFTMLAETNGMAWAIKTMPDIITNLNWSHDENCCFVYCAGITHDSENRNWLETLILGMGLTQSQYDVLVSQAGVISVTYKQSCALNALDQVTDHINLVFADPMPF